ncbi:MAG TPA: pyridoxal-dependent decarboxylase, partial [Kineosporiaceae bacterium]|nr:pyridoxal-dependent decarboxylase [Kineosporiaceae bacterium]
PDHRLTGDAVRAALAAQADPDAAAKQGWWFHVDGAYGGAGLFAPSVRARYRGIERADSFIVDPHKWLFTPFDCCALIYRDPALARAVHTQDASYLDVIHSTAGEWNPTDYAYHLTRRARGLPLWFSLAVHGTRAYGEAIEAAIELARRTADEIRKRPQLELIREPDLSVVLFRRVGWSAADYTAWADALHREQVAFIPPSSWEGDVVGRFAFLHPHTPIDLVREILDRTA